MPLLPAPIILREPESVPASQPESLPFLPEPESELAAVFCLSCTCKRGTLLDLSLNPFEDQAQSGKQEARGKSRLVSAPS